MAELDYSIGDAARISGIKIPTIRYYEEIGLLSGVARSEGNRRFYGADDLRRLAFIRHARELGFPMDEIRTLLKLQDDPNQSCAAADAIATARLQDVERRIARLERLRTELLKMVEQCAAGRVGECRVIETLADPTHTHGRLADE
ncbi:MerR family transcriptional regulator [Aquabacter sp. P-9]|uniref:MerR family transcriptional regulator n=1 Tax=Aquabacter sediminis TaxID=3029197 RepID=UPI00237E7E2D|nr:helix-turn-helix domain-containing protein [Aquabacter sp. P-9]MDE1567934.1 helix-turn-helix domain-containing protein [Aquabacter sp. P-9]